MAILRVPPPARWGRRAVLGTAATMFAAVTLLRWFVDGSGQAAALMYVVPVALVGVTLGLRGGMLASTLGSALFAGFAGLHGRGDLDATGWLGPMLAMYLVGGLLGLSSQVAEDRSRTALAEGAHRRELEEVCFRQREALEAGDLIVQGMAVATWMVESGRTEEALALLRSTVEEGTRRLSPVLPRERAAPNPPARSR